MIRFSPRGFLRAMSGLIPSAAPRPAPRQASRVDGVMKVCDVRPGWHPPNSVVRKYGTDTTGTVTYRFNSRGYRGEEYQPDSKFKLCLIGDEHGFGVGLPQEQTFAHLLKSYFAAALKMRVPDVNIVNLSAGGVSGDYCLRTIYRQLPDCEFDLVICQIPPPNRTEFFDGKVFRALSTADVTPANRETAYIPLLAYCDYYNDFIGRSTLARNVLLMQDYLKDRGIDHVIATGDELFGAAACGDAAEYMHWIDRQSIFVHRYFADMADRSACKVSSGPRTQAAFAIALLDFVGQMKLQQGNQDSGSRLLRHAAKLKATDKNWLFCSAHFEKPETYPAVRVARAGGQTERPLP